jgi:hypothetical protein
MWKWIVLAWHRVTSSTVGEYLAKALVIVEKDFERAGMWAKDRWNWAAELRWARQTRDAAIAGLETLAEHELAAIERDVEALKVRSEKLLDAGIAVGERTIDALCLHAHLTNAVEKSPPPVRP